MKKKNIRRANQENPNQLSFEFLLREPQIDVHIPRTTVKSFNTHLTKTKHLAIKLAEG